jgi:hypothetical protein
MLHRSGKNMKGRQAHGMAIRARTPLDSIFFKN